MFSRTVVGLLGGLSCFAFSSLSHAQCSKDTDCKGDRVCEAGTCVSPAPLPPAPAAPVVAPSPGAEASAPAAGSAPPAAAPAPPAPSATVSEPLDRDRDREERRREKPPRHSTGMMAGGIVMVSFVPVALLVSLVANLEQDSCKSGGVYLSGSSVQTRDTDCGRFDPTIYGGLIVAAGLAGAGIPMIVIGGKREPVGTASVTPWAAPGAGGLRLRVDL